MATFHPFPRLPFELRARIWELTVAPRTVEVRVPPRTVDARLMYAHRDTPSRLASPTPVPAVLQACREARTAGLYTRAFAEVGDCDGRYVWLDLAIDTVSIGTTPFSCFAPVAPSIRRLQFERSHTEECFYHWESKGIWDFVNAEEMVVVCEDGLWAWWGAAEEHFWPCGPENVVMIDPDDGRRMGLVEMECMFDERHERLDAQYRTEEEAERLEEECRRAEESIRKKRADYGYDLPMR